MKKQAVCFNLVVQLLLVVLIVVQLIFQPAIGNAGALYCRDVFSKLTYEQLEEQDEARKAVKARKSEIFEDMDFFNPLFSVVTRVLNWKAQLFQRKNLHLNPVLFKELEVASEVVFNPDIFSNISALESRISELDKKLIQVKRSKKRASGKDLELLVSQETLIERQSRQLKEELGYAKETWSSSYKRLSTLVETFTSYRERIESLIEEGIAADLQFKTYNQLVDKYKHNDVFSEEVLIPIYRNGRITYEVRHLTSLRDLKIMAGLSEKYRDEIFIGNQGKLGKAELEQAQLKEQLTVVLRRVNQANRMSDFEASQTELFDQIKDGLSDTLLSPTVYAQFWLSREIYNSESKFRVDAMMNSDLANKIRDFSGDVLQDKKKESVLSSLKLDGMDKPVTKALKNWIKFRIIIILFSASSTLATIGGLVNEYTNMFILSESNYFKSYIRVVDDNFSSMVKDRFRLAKVAKSTNFEKERAAYFQLYYPDIMSELKAGHIDRINQNPETKAKLQRMLDNMIALELARIEREQIDTNEKANADKLTKQQKESEKFISGFTQDILTKEIALVRIASLMNSVEFTISAQEYVDQLKASKEDKEFAKLFIESHSEKNPTTEELMQIPDTVRSIVNRIYQSRQLMADKIKDGSVTEETIKGIARKNITKALLEAGVK